MSACLNVQKIERRKSFERGKKKRGEGTFERRKGLNGGNG
jgi:hypothetical protein